MEDIISDLSVFHRIGDWRALDGPAFFSLAERLPFYKGTLRARAEAQAMRGSKSGGSAPAPSNAEYRTIESDATTLGADPALAGLIEFG